METDPFDLGLYWDDEPEEEADSLNDVVDEEQDNAK